MCTVFISSSARIVSYFSGKATESLTSAIQGPMHSGSDSDKSPEDEGPDRSLPPPTSIAHVSWYPPAAPLPRFQTTSQSGTLSSTQEQQCQFQSHHPASLRSVNPSQPVVQARGNQPRLPHNLSVNAATSVRQLPGATSYEHRDCILRTPGPMSLTPGADPRARAAVHARMRALVAAWPNL